jgi:hypothetical protein
VAVDAALKYVEAVLLAAEKKVRDQQRCDYGDSWDPPAVVSGVKLLTGKVPGGCARLYERLLFRVA